MTFEKNTLSSNKKKPTILLGLTALIVVLFVSPMSILTAAYSSAQSLEPNLSLSPAPLIFSPAPNVACGNVHELCPSMLTKAYDMDKMHNNGINGTGQAVVIDDACGDPNIKSDLSGDSQIRNSTYTLLRELHAVILDGLLRLHST